MKIRYSLTAAAAMALTLAACGGGTDDATTDAATDEATAAADAGAVSAASAEGAIGGGAQGFVTQAAASDMYEIEAGKLAQQMGTSQAVKDFGGMLVTEHTKSSAELKTAAQSAEGVTVPAALPADKQAQIDALKNAGGRFDAVFKEQQVAAHSAALALLEGYGSNGDNEALKAFATKTAPVVEKHLEQARTLP